MEIIPVEIPFSRLLGERESVELMYEIIDICKRTPIKPCTYVQCSICYYEKSNGINCETCEKAWHIHNESLKRKTRSEPNCDDIRERLAFYENE